jgi:hypothetical protein
MEVDWHFGRKYCFHLQGHRVNQARNQQETSSWLLAIHLEHGGSIFLQNASQLLLYCTMSHHRRQYSSYSDLTLCSPSYCQHQWMNLYGELILRNLMKYNLSCMQSSCQSPGKF